MYPNQFGFRENHGTNIALTFLYNKILKSLDNGDYVLGLFLDFKKAFDTVNHDILLRKLYKYGIRGTSFEWIKSYLSNRKQYVYFNQEKSTALKIICRIPQGSILGPILFLCYINDIAQVSDSLL